MKFYKRDNIKCISQEVNLPGFIQVDSFDFDKDEIYYLYHDESIEAQGIHIIESIEFIEAHYESIINKLSYVSDKSEVGRLIDSGKLIGLNLSKVNFNDIYKLNKKNLKVHVLGLGDVGGIMLTGLRLLGGNVISEIGIFDLDESKVKRWIYELNQIRSIDRGRFPDVKAVTFDDIFDCDVFIFTASTAIPEVGSDVKDVRMFQLEGNSKIISIYAKKAKEVGYKGQFIVVSDPVDLLCRQVLNYGEGIIRPEQIKGFGLGVMHARAVFYAEEMSIEHFEECGRAFGPHGKDLIIADNVLNYNNDISLELTDKTVKANLDVRACGYKPFIAPALSSAALSILAYLNGDYNYSTVYLDGVYFGCKNKSLSLCKIITEKNYLNEQLMERINTTFEELKSFEF